MQNRNNISAPLTISTVSIPGTVGSSISGAVVGTGQASQASSQSAHELNSAERDSLLKALDALCNRAQGAQDDNMPGLNLFPDGLQDILESIRKGGASTARNLLIAPVMTGSHLSQLPVDVTASVQALLHSINDFRPFFQTRAASILDLDKELQEKQSFLSANCKALCNNISNVSDQIKKEINNEYVKEGSAHQSHAKLAHTFASTAMTASMGTAGLVSLVFDAVGSSFREVSGLVSFSKMESTHPQEKNIYRAFCACCASGSKSQNSRESLVALRNLEAAILDFKPASDMSDAHSLTAPSISVFTRLLTSAPFVETLTAFNASALALTEAHQALSHERDQFYAETKRSATLASSLNQCQGGNHHSANVSQFCAIVDAAIGHIDGDLAAIANHGSIAGSAKSTVRSYSSFSVIPSLITGFTGMISREFSGSVDFSRHDKGSKQESTLTSQSRKDMTGADLDQLLSRVCALKERLERCQELGVSAPVVLGISEAVISGSFIASLNVLAGMYSALREFRTMSHSPSHATVLNEAEQMKAAEYAQSVIASNQKSAGTTGGGSSSANLSLHQQIASVMRKMVLINRSKMNFSHPGMERNDLDSAGKSSIAFTQGNSTGFMLGSTAVMSLVSLESGIGTEACLGAMQYLTQAKRMCGGVDRIESANGSKSNFSFASNATRLSEDSIKGSSFSNTISKTTHHVLESVFSRSLTVGLCESGALTEMLRRIVREEYENLNHAPGFLDSALTSDALMPQLGNHILKVLDDAEVNQNPIPGLNKDMASSMASGSNVSIATAISAHSCFITPILKSIVASKKASIIPENIKNEALSANSEVSRIVSTSLNQLQAFTDKFKDELLLIPNPLQHSSIADTVDSTQVRSASVACAMSLFCEELFEICISRSLTLLDKERIVNTSQTTRVESREQTHLSANASTEDSALDQKSQISHVITALRLTVSHLGNSLGELASKIDSDSKLLKDNLEIHSSQKSFLKSMSSSLATFSQAMLGISAGLSQFPASSVGSIESIRECVHSIDQHLVLKPIHSSENCSRESGSDSTLITGIGTDCVSSILCTVTKLLVRASVFGLDTSLSISKILEILCLHPDPSHAFSLESQDMSQPNGFTHNLTEVKQNISVSTTLGAASICAASKTGDSMSTENALRTLQAAIDHQIEKVALLEDEENENKISLKQFFEILAKLVSKKSGDHDNEYKDLIQRFDRGGIALSSYHSDHGSLLGVNHDERPNNPLIIDDKFLGCDDAAALLSTFINKAYKQEHNEGDNLLNKLKSAIGNLNHLSSRSQACYEFIVNKVIDRLKLEATRQSIFKPGEGRTNKDKWVNRKNDLLRNVTIEALVVEIPHNELHDNNLERVDI